MVQLVSRDGEDRKKAGGRVLRASEGPGNAITEVFKRKPRRERGKEVCDKELEDVEGNGSC